MSITKQTYPSPPLRLNLPRKVTICAILTFKYISTTGSIVVTICGQIHIHIIHGQSTFAWIRGYPRDIPWLVQHCYQWREVDPESGKKKVVPLPRLITTYISLFSRVFSARLSLAEHLAQPISRNSQIPWPTLMKNDLPALSYL